MAVPPARMSFYFIGKSFVMLYHKKHTSCEDGQPAAMKSSIVEDGCVLFARLIELLMCSIMA